MVVPGSGHAHWPNPRVPPQVGPARARAMGGFAPVELAVVVPVRYRSNIYSESDGIGSQSRVSYNGKTMTRGQVGTGTVIVWSDITNLQRYVLCRAHALYVVAFG